MVEEAKEIKLKELYVYPVKSCSPVKIDSFNVGRTGLKYDRCWVIVDAEGVYVDLQRKSSLMYWIKQSIDFENSFLCLDYEGLETLKVPLEGQSNYKVREFRLKKNKYQGYDCGDEVGAWLDDVFQDQGYRLIRQTPEIRYGKHKFDEDNHERISFNNKSQYLMVCDKSIEWLLDRLNEKYELESNDEDFWTVEKLLYRFRANFYVTGTTKEFEEEAWNELELCNVKLKVHGPCGRCLTINVSNAEIAHTGTEPLEILKALREERPVPFGVYMGKEKDDDNVEKISVGCTVNILKSTVQ